MHVISVFLQVLLGLMFAFLGISSLIGSKKALENFNHLQLPTWFRMVTGVVQVIGAVGILMGIWNPVFRIFSGIWIGITMLVAVFLHVRLKEPFSQSVPALVVLVIAMAVVLINI